MDGLDNIIAAQTDNGKRIGTARDHIGAVRAGQLSLVAWLRAQAFARGFKFNPTPNETIAANINHGRWIVKCPACPGAEDADPREPLFYCLSCGNAKNQGQCYAVIFPSGRALIEAILLTRPMANRNWLPGEQSEDLRRENFENQGGRNGVVGA